MKQTIKEFESTLSTEERILFQYQLKAYRYLEPYLLDQFKMEDELGHEVTDKGEEGKAFDYDMAVNTLLNEALKEADYQGDLYSEETKWTSYGSADEVILADPICGSSLLRKGFRNVGSGVTWFKDSKFVAGAVSDFATHTLCLANRERAIRIQVRGNEAEIRLAAVSDKKELEWAFVVFSLFSEKGRKELLEKTTFIQDLPLIVGIFGGQPTWASLTQGHIDAYFSLPGGTRIYEFGAAEIAKRAGAVVIDLAGGEMNVGDHLEALRKDENTKIPFIAAATRELAEQLLSFVKK